MDVPYCFLSRYHFLRTDDRLNRFEGMTYSSDLQQGNLIHFGRVANAEPNRESVELGLREWKCTLVLKRVLRRKHQEGPQHRMRNIVHRYLPLRHTFQEGRLSPGSRSIQFVDQNDIGKHRTRAKLELSLSLMVNRGASCIRRQ